ncbi:MAG TPA: rod-binding protein [bacterium]|nr:rod-binding protein [bacterium]
MNFDGLNGIKNQYIPTGSERLGSEAESKLKSIENKTSAASGSTEKELKALDSASKELESLFVYMLMKEMRKTVQETEFMHGGRGEEIFRDLLDEEMSKKMAQGPGDGIGIAKMVYEQLSRPLISKLKAEQSEAMQMRGDSAGEQEKEIE